MLRQPQSNAGNGYSDNDEHGCAIETLLVTCASEISATESIKAKSGQMRSNSRVSSRGFTGTHIFRVGNSHAFNFRGMDRTGVITTGSGGGPRVDFSERTITIFNKQVHGVASFNRLDSAPANGESMKRIDHNDSFVIKNNLGSNEESECCGTNQTAPDYCCQNIMEISINDRSTRQTHAEYEESQPINNIRARSEDFGVTHLGSFSRKIEGSAR